MHTDDLIPGRSDSKETVHRRGLPGADTLHKQKNTQKKEKKTKRKKAEGEKAAMRSKHAGEKLSKNRRDRRTDGKRRKKKGPYHLASHPAG